MLGFFPNREINMPKEPAVVINGDHVSVYLYVVDAPGNTFAWEVVETRDKASEVIERKLVSEESYPTFADAEVAGKLTAAAVAKGLA